MNLTDGLTDWAQRHPFAVAMIDNGSVVHYRTLERATWRAAAWFLAHGIGPGQVVGIATGSAFGHLLAALGLARMGAVQIALSPMDTVEQRRSLARRAGAVAVVGNPDKVSDLGLPVLSLPFDWAREAGHPVDPAIRAPGGSDPWAIITSSGTTGAPKMFAVSHQKELWRDQRIEQSLDLPPGGRILSLINMAFASGKRTMLCCLTRGRAVVLDHQAFPPQIDAVMAAIERHDVQALYATPLHLEQLLGRCPVGTIRLPALRTVWTTSSVVPEKLRRAVRERLNPNLVVAYGSNEVGFMTLADSAAQRRHPATIGSPVTGVEVEIVDDAGAPLPAGAIGRLRLRGPGMEVAYIDDPDATARACRDGWFYPGDLAALAEDGAVIFHGRADDAMNFDGVKIYPAEVEAVLLQHPAVAEAAAFPVASDLYQHIPAAAVVLRSEVPETDIAAFCRERLGGRYPRWISVLDELPRNAMGKVLKRELATALATRLTTAVQPENPPPQPGGQAAPVSAQA